MKRFTTIFLLLIFIYTALVGCSNKSLSSSKDIKIFASLSSEEGFLSLIADAMKTSAENNNIDLNIKSAEKDIETQVNDIKAAKDNGYNIITCFLVDPNTAQQIINAAEGIPVIFVNMRPDDSKLKENQNIYIASNEEAVAEKTADYLVNYFKGKSSFDAVMLEGDVKNQCTFVRTETVKSKLKQKGYNINCVFQDEAGWNRETAKEMFKIFLKLNKNYDCVIANNDEMALGVVDALEEEGIDPSSVPILGVDAIEDACKSISEGKMAFTLKQSAEGQGESIINAAIALKNGEEIKNLDYADKSGKYILYPYAEVDKNNVSQYLK